MTLVSSSKTFFVGLAVGVLFGICCQQFGVSLDGDGRRRQSRRCSSETLLAYQKALIKVPSRHLSTRYLSMVTVEICLDDIKSALEAKAGGANTVELCINRLEGGVTPSIGFIEECVHLLRGSEIEIHVLIRPRPGGFVYSAEEFDVILREILASKAAGVHGVVVGILKANGDIDEDRMAVVRTLSQGIQLTFHRAFDVCTCPERALETVISLGCDRLLTSAQSGSALDGVPLMRKLVKQAAGRIRIIAASGVSADNACRIILNSGVDGVHAGSSVVHSIPEVPPSEYRGYPIKNGKPSTVVTTTGTSTSTSTNISRSNQTVNKGNLQEHPEPQLQTDGNQLTSSETNSAACERGRRVSVGLLGGENLNQVICVSSVKVQRLVENANLAWSILAERSLSGSFAPPSTELVGIQSRNAVVEVTSSCASSLTANNHNFSSSSSSSSSSGTSSSTTARKAHVLGSFSFNRKKAAAGFPSIMTAAAISAGATPRHTITDIIAEDAPPDESTKRWLPSSSFEEDTEEEEMKDKDEESCGCYEGQHSPQQEMQKQQEPEGWENYEEDNGDGDDKMWEREHWDHRLSIRRSLSGSGRPSLVVHSKSESLIIESSYVPLRDDPHDLIGEEEDEEA